MSRISHPELERKSVGFNDHGVLTNEFEAWGWHMNLDESVIFSVGCDNPGPYDIRITRAKPFTTGPWMVETIFDVPAGTNRIIEDFKPDNEDQFFTASYKDGTGSWIPIDGGNHNTSAERNPDESYCAMTWAKPQVVNLGLRAH